MHLRKIRRPHMWPLALLFSAIAVVLVLRAPVGAQVRSRTVFAPTTPRAESALPMSHGDTLPPVKQAILDRIQQLRREGLNRIRSAVIEPPPHTTPAPWPSGIFERSQAPLPASLYTITNQWQNDVGGRHVQVYVGAETPFPSQGVVIVQTTSLDLQTVRTMTYLTPVTSGRLRIVAAQGSQLTLTAASGTSYVFDVVARTLLSKAP